MVVVIEGYNAHKYPDLIEDMFRMRARIFHDRLKWDVQVIDGKERDKYDDEGPVYLIHTDEQARKVKGSLRLLPTTGPTLLAEFFSDTCPDAVHLSSPTIWECTRFCLDDKLLDRGMQEERLIASAVLITALGDLAVRSGIETVIGNFEASMLRLYRRIGCEIEVIGSTSRYGRPIYLGLFPISESLVRKGKERLASARMGLAKASDMAA
jgi:N-acyl-L-homoserine lactone synthetase